MHRTQSLVFQPAALSRYNLALNQNTVLTFTALTCKYVVKLGSIVPCGSRNILKLMEITRHSGEIYGNVN